MKYLAIILTASICVIIALGILISLFGRATEVLNESPATSKIAPNPAPKTPAPTRDWDNPFNIKG